ncbi:ABC transporter ATP-binding protein (plasmid) [Arthrobacter sp. KN11-1C]|uniref:ABC transporter ATP-binding protein n=1 Tax=Arthrobacter sp. KN11-1C TaxID=3445774 RepID=UPI003FA11A2E
MQDNAGSQGTLPSVRLTGLTKVFGGNTAVHPTDLVIGRNEFFSILGPSGCGKTTLMRMITGFEEPTGGTVELDGANVTGVPTRKRDLNMLFQSYALFPHLSVYENIAFELRVRRMKKAAVDLAVREAVELVRLTGMERRKPDQLSGGQRQRVALARAVVSRPAIVLLDEPLGALDQQLRKEMQFELKRMQREVGITFVYVTHDQEEALTMSDRIAVMNAGRIQQIGSPEDIYDRPANAFVAGFIGTCNLLKGTVDGSAFRIPGLPELPIATDRVHDGGTVLTVRPEHTRLSAAPIAKEGWVSVRAAISESAFCGDERRYHVLLHGTEPFIVVEQADTVTSFAAGLREGEEAWVSWPTAHARVIRA